MSLDRNFKQLLRNNWRNNNLVCVGLDPDWDKIPDILKRFGNRLRPRKQVLMDFNREIINETWDIAGTYKLQSSYYECFGPRGLEALLWTRKYLEKVAGSTPTILDAKRADIDRTNRGYVTSIFDYYGFDAVTLHPYLGGEQALIPFLERKEKGCIILCRTSNKDGGEFQDSKLALTEMELDELLSGPAGTTRDKDVFKASCYAIVEDIYVLKLYEKVALRVANYWNTNQNCYLVVGATYPTEAARIRRLVGDGIDFLVPGVGTQNGQIEQAVRACRNSSGEGLIVNSSSGIIHASSGYNFAKVARQKAIQLNDQINEYRFA